MSIVLGIPTTETLRPRLLTSCMDNQVELLSNCPSNAISLTDLIYPNDFVKMFRHIPKQIVLIVILDTSKIADAPF